MRISFLKKNDTPGTSSRSKGCDFRILFLFFFRFFFFEIKFDWFFFSKKNYINRQILDFKSQQTHKMIKNSKKINVLKMVHMKIHLKFHDGHQHFFLFVFFNKINMPLKSENVIFLISKSRICMQPNRPLVPKMMTM